MSLSPWTGQTRAVSSVVEGGGGPDGVILSLQLVGSGIYDVAYTLHVGIGDGSKTYALQVDTGSSDLWVASSSCSTSTCDPIGGGNLYNPSNAMPTGYDFNITYLEGFVSGPIVWDQVNVGGYSIGNQALAAATIVNKEPLGSDFEGILGLALPLNSIIAGQIHTVMGNAPDGAALASNLFSITPVTAAPSAHFISLSLSRPGSDRISSMLGIGHHPSSLVSDPSKIYYSTLVSERDGALYWKVGVRAITVYVDGVAKPIDIGRSSSGMVFPTAVLDSGIPLILTTSRIANGIYGALGIGPAADGQYYVPCTTPLNMTITLDDRPEIPLHPLDLTAEPPDNNRAQYCVGIIQADDNQLANPSSGIGDMILGVPFLRNTYTVMAYTAPYENGTFPDPTSFDNDIVLPHLGLLNLTDPIVALDEFNTVRLLNRPISSGGSNHTGNAGLTTVGPKRLSIGVIVLVALIGFFSLCCALFGLRWYLLKRKFKNDSARLDGNPDVLDLENKIVETHGDSDSSTVNGVPDKEGMGYIALETSVAEARPRGLSQPKERMLSQYTASSGRTMVDNASVASEFGYGIGMGGKRDIKDSFGSRWSAADEMFVHRSVRVSQRSTSAGSASKMQPHERNASLFTPLLSSPQYRRSQSFDTDGAPSPVVSPTTTGQHEVYGFAAVPVKENPGPSHAPDGVLKLEVPGPMEEIAAPSQTQPAGGGVPDLGEFGYRLSRPGDDGGGGGGGDSGGGTLGSTGSMAGIGTAAVARRRLSQFESLSFPRESFFSSTSGTVRASAASGDEEPWYSPPALDNPEVESPAAASTRNGEAVHFPVLPSPVLISGGAGKPDFVQKSSSLDDFDPYAEYPQR